MNLKSEAQNAKSERTLNFEIRNTVAETRKHFQGGAVRSGIRISDFGFRILIAVVGFAFSTLARGNNAATPAAFSTFASAPLYFEGDGGAQFIARGAECSVLIAPTEAEMALGTIPDKLRLSGTESRHDVHLRLVGANPDAKIAGMEQVPARANYFIGNDPGKWLAGVPLFSRVQVDDVYPGVRVVYYANQSAQLEYDFLLRPGVRPEQIRFRVEGADSVTVDASGNLVLKVDGEEIRQHQPVAYQEGVSGRKEIPIAYRPVKDGTVGFAVGSYDQNLPLVIDPTLDFLTYLGGKKFDVGWAIALDSNQNIYVTGETISRDFPATNGIVLPTVFGTNRFFTNYQGGTAAFGDAFIASYDSNGVVRYVTYLGGKKDDGALSIAEDGSGGVWVTGFTDSTDFPLVNPLAGNTNLTGPNNNAGRIFPADAFIAHVDFTGSNLDYSTYFGGSFLDEGVGIAVVASNQVYVTGLTMSTNLPVTPNAFSNHLAGDFDAFLLKLVDGTNAYTTYLGGTNADYGLSVAVDSKSNAWVTGITYSTNFPTANFNNLTNDPNFTNHLFGQLNNQTNSAHHNSAFRSDGFVTEIAPDGTVPFSAYLGGTNDDSGSHIFVDTNTDNVYITGYTFSGDFPTNRVTTPLFDLSPFPLATNGIAYPGGTTNFISHVFVTEIAGQTITNSTQFGGDGADRGLGIGLDTNGNVFVVGSTGSTNFFPTNIVILTNEISMAGITNKRGVFTNYNGIPTNNPTFANLSTTNFPLKHGIHTNDIFIAELTPGLTNFVQSIVLGGNGSDQANGIAVDPSGAAVYIVGATTSTNIATTNAAQKIFGGLRGGRTLPDAFIGKILLP